MSIEKRGENNYRFRVTHRGVKYDVTAYFATDKEAKKAHDQFKLDVKTGKIAEQIEQQQKEVKQREQERTLREIWELYIKSKDLAYGTICNHRSTQRRFSALLDLPMSTVTRTQMLEMYNKEGQRNAHSYRTIKAIFNFAIELGLMEENPVCFKLKSTKKERYKPLLSEDELQLLLTYLLDHQEDVKAVFCLSQLLLGTRYGETAGKLREDIDTVDHTAKTSHQHKWLGRGNRGIGELKTLSSLRETPIPELLRGPLYKLTLKTPQRGYIFACADKKPPTIIAVNKYLEGVCKDIGVSKLTTHDLRRLHATIAIYSGMDLFSVSRLLGHSSVSMTEQYIKELKGKTKKEATKIDVYLDNLS